MDTLNLTKFFTTRSQARAFTEALSRVADQVYVTGFNLEQSLTEQLGFVKKDLFLQLLQQNTISLQEPSALRKFLDDVVAKVAAMPTLKMTIAIEPNEQLLRSVLDWCEINIGDQVILDVAVDPRLIAGTTIQFGGKYLDLSIKPLVEKILSEPVLPPVGKFSQDKAHTLSNID